jgi:hypothetical protein
MGKIDENKRLKMIKIEIIEEKCFFLNLIKNYKINKIHELQNNCRKLS